MTYTFHSEAYDEFLAAIAYYRIRGSSLSIRFVDEIGAAIDQIVEAPLRWPLYDKAVRRYVINAFPYVILYTLDGEELRIIAVMHCSREPGYWRARRE